MSQDNGTGDDAGLTGCYATLALCVICGQERASLSHPTLKERYGQVELGLSVCRECSKLRSLPARINQCDGCRRGLPLHDGRHVSDDSAWDTIGCTAKHYLQ